MSNVQSGEALILRVTLPYEDDTKFIKAIVKDDSGIELNGSPFILVNQGGGIYKYKNPTVLTFPSNALEVSAIYRIYDDNQFLVPTLDYGHQLEDVFRKLDISVDTGTEFNSTLIAMQKFIDDTIKLRDDISIEIENDEEVMIEMDGLEEPVEVVVDADEDIMVEAPFDESVDIIIDDDEILDIEIQEGV